MTFEHKPNSGSLFVNDKKDKDSHPDRTGSALIGGVEYWVSGWINDGTKGKYLGMKFTPKDEEGQQQDTSPGHNMMYDKVDF